MHEREGSQESEVEGPGSTFASLYAEGDGLLKQGDYAKAIEAFTKVLFGLWRCMLFLCIGVGIKNG